jgi:hypothetical protein
VQKCDSLGHNKLFVVHDNGWELKQILLRNNVIEAEILYLFFIHANCIIYYSLVSYILTLTKSVQIFLLS